MMIFVNEITKLEKLPKYALKNLILCLAPYAPHIAEEIYALLGFESPVLQASWPSYDEKYCTDSSCVIVVQVNGKMRGKFETSTDTAKEELERQALKTESVQKWIEGKQIKKVIVVPNKIVNIVLL